MNWLGATLAKLHASESKKSLRAVKLPQSLRPSRCPSPSPRSPSRSIEAAERDTLTEKVAHETK